MRAFFVNHRLAFGSAVTNWRHVEKLRARGITHVLNVRRCQNQKIRQFRNLWLGFKDNAKGRPAWFYRRALLFYRRAMSRPGAKMYVMCRHGIRRSPSVVYFLLRASGASRRKAETLVHRARPQARVARAYRDSAEAFLRNLNESA